MLAAAMQRLVDALPRPLGQNTTVTLADYWCRALADPRFSEALQDCDDRRADDWRTEPASVLFFLTNLASSPVAEALKPLLSRIKSNVPAADWRKARDRWLGIREYAMRRKANTPITPKNAVERRMHLDAITACNRLISL